MAVVGTGKRSMRQMSVQEKISAVQRVHDGESKASVARLIGVPESTLRGWCKNEMKLRIMTASSPSPSPPPEKRPRVEAPAEQPVDADETGRAIWMWLCNQHRYNDPMAHSNSYPTRPSWFWKWHKKFGFQGPVPPHDPDQPLPLVVRKNKVSLTTT